MDHKHSLYGTKYYMSPIKNIQFTGTHNVSLLALNDYLVKEDLFCIIIVILVLAGN
jgi:hypothetical protein